FHRIVPGFVIQGGDPKGDGTGGPGYKVVEAPPKTLQYTKGVVAMAKTQLEAAGTSGSQFFVVTGEDAQLPADYALLGKVTGGLERGEHGGCAEDGKRDPEDPRDPAPAPPPSLLRKLPRRRPLVQALLGVIDGLPAACVGIAHLRHRKFDGRGRRPAAQRRCA